MSKSGGNTVHSNLKQLKFYHGQIAEWSKSTSKSVNIHRIFGWWHQPNIVIWYQPNIDLDDYIVNQIFKWKKKMLKCKTAEYVYHSR